MALTPTVVDGGIIQSAWGNEIRDRTVQVFASEAERDAQWPTAAIGSLANIAGTLYRKITATAWAQHAGPLYYVADDWTSMAAAGAGVIDRVLTFPVQPISTFISIRSMAYAGFSSGGLTNIILALWSNNMSSPGGGAWFTQGPPKGAVGGGVWADVGSVTYTALVAAGQNFTGAARISYTPAANNCHVRIVTSAEVWKW